MTLKSRSLDRHLFLLAAGTAALAGCSDSIAPEEMGQPNIILIVTDDQAVGEELRMPTLQRLAREGGMSFSRAFVTTPLCGPSRASILTGQYGHNHRVTTNRVPLGGFVRFRVLGLERSTVATSLDGAGYRTAFFGKYLNDYGTENHTDWDYVPPGWDEWYGMVGWAPTSPYVDYSLNENGTLVRYTGEEEYEADVLAQKAVDFIARALDDGEPFFAMISPTAPHRPARPARRHAGMFAGIKAPRSPSFNEEDLTDKPQGHRRPLLSDAAIFTLDSLYGLRLESLQAVDDLLGAVWDRVVSRGVDDRTYVLFTSDNGFHLGEHRSIFGKSKPFEEDLHVPLVVIGPGAAGATVADIVLSIDLAPTILDLAGVSTPALVDGMSFGHLLGRGGGSHSPRAFVAEQWPATTETPTWRTLRTETHFYTEWDDGGRELYDLRTDPYQLENLAAVAGDSGLVAYGELLRQLSGCVGSACGLYGRLPVSGTE